MGIYQNIAALFRYPDRFVNTELCELEKFVAAQLPEQIAAAQRIAEHFSATGLNEQREYYIRTFDVNATCYLDLGYVIFGEDTKRGQMLIEMNREQERAGNDCGKEFSDHLPNVLVLLEKTKDTEFRDELATGLLMPALRLMIRNFRNDENIYKQLLILLEQILTLHYPDVSYELLEQRNFSNTCYENHGCSMHHQPQKNPSYV